MSIGATTNTQGVLQLQLLLSITITFQPLLNMLQLIKLHILNSQICLHISLIKHIKSIKDLTQQKQEHTKPGNTGKLFWETFKKSVGKKKEVVQGITQSFKRV